MMGGRLSDADAKKQLKTLTRTDFLLQFVWQPAQAGGSSPRRRKSERAKIKEMVDKIDRGREEPSRP